MEFQANAAEIARAKHLHSILLFDFIVIHVFVFILALSMLSATPIPLFVMPVLSLSLLGYVLVKAKRSITTETSQFVLCHNLLAAKRARLFLALFVVTFSFTAIMLFGGAQFGLSKISSYALAFGIGQLPFMVTLLVLVVLEFDAEHQCKNVKVPAAAQALLAGVKKA